MVVGQSACDNRGRYSVFQTDDKISTRRARFIKYVGVTISYYDGKKRRDKLDFVYSDFFLPFFRCLDTMLRKRHRISAFIREKKR